MFRGRCNRRDRERPSGPQVAIESHEVRSFPVCGHGHSPCNTRSRSISESVRPERSGGLRRHGVRDSPEMNTVLAVLQCIALRSHVANERPDPLSVRPYAHLVTAIQDRISGILRVRSRWGWSNGAPHLRFSGGVVHLASLVVHPILSVAEDQARVVYAHTVERFGGFSIPVPDRELNVELPLESPRLGMGLEIR